MARRHRRLEPLDLPLTLPFRKRFPKRVDKCAHMIYIIHMSNTYTASPTHHEAVTCPCPGADVKQEIKDQFIAAVEAHRAATAEGSLDRQMGNARLGKEYRHIAWAHGYETLGDNYYAWGQRNGPAVDTDRY